MIYLGDKDVKHIRLNWEQNIDVIATATQCIKSKDIAQPVKPYLRYGDPKNRIIAMPAFIGGDINRSGIKWIASFPDNIKKDIPRAHGVIILNEAETGQPLCVINSGSISAIRTASVSGLIVRKFMELKRHHNLKIGIIGFGPIGQYHLNMCSEVLGENIGEVLLYDLNGIVPQNIPDAIKDKVRVVESWEKAYVNADIFITCTVSKEPYINLKPKLGSLHLNVSLRDYKTDVFPWFVKGMIVDDWQEVCRENTDVENFNKVNGLQENDVRLIQDVLNDFLFTLDKDQPIMFNPMGMAVFDIAIANHYMGLATRDNVGVVLDDSVPHLN
ncbi:2,3-diaminopropionate biosynthesis protein SbnB [Flavobacterium cupreum]|uniref:2,3-diaminopropionate biosynthesis protein SbnB n=1 Tax=Flavobacterium cupreum TaxID=2133766 RepID=A0A434A2Q2_9FLAO|nr:2,3-diaminopropionate biosynthesis protein SbnB [Flavobacterium cupreum]RUT68616.1 2,3-diaminopropionate biosynthesis protein SbnB [Flavobacterium cupreum]